MDVRGRNDAPWSVSTEPRDRARPARIGRGFVAVDAIGVAAGWLGRQAPRPPRHDVLSRGGPDCTIAAVIGAAVGALVTRASVKALWLRGSHV